jgi:2,4-dienoyl-CoA reductase-like NADH-dependent reductase (Old Yellow Enzyme family)
MEIDECIEVARILEQEGVHALVLSGGFVSKAPMYVMRGSMPLRTLTYYMKNIPLKLGIRLAGKWMIPSEPFEEAYFLEDALKFRQAVKLPLIYVGGLLTGAKINEVLDSGFEFVAMARALINEPDFVNRLKLNSEARNPCTTSNYCIARMYTIEMACHQHIEGLPAFIQKEISG